MSKYQSINVKSQMQFLISYKESRSLPFSSNQNFLYFTYFWVYVLKTYMDVLQILLQIVRKIHYFPNKVDEKTGPTSYSLVYY